MHGNVYVMVYSSQFIPTNQHQVGRGRVSVVVDMWFNNLTMEVADR